MNIALIGYGNMGKEIERVLAESKKNMIVSISYTESNQKLDLEGIQKADVAIDFTAPSVVLTNIEKVLDLGVNMVVGTTGWLDRLPEVEKMVVKSKKGLIYGGNFSVGGNIFFQIVAYASSLFSHAQGYDIAGLEKHHTGKKDSPSGTARKLADIILANSPQKKKIETGRLDRQIQQDEMHFASLRVGRNFGYHEIIFDSFADTITLSHAAHNRRGFAEGAILAAEFIQGKKGLFTFETLFSKR